MMSNPTKGELEMVPNPAMHAAEKKNYFHPYENDHIYRSHTPNMHEDMMNTAPEYGHQPPP